MMATDARRGSGTEPRWLRLPRPSEMFERRAARLAMLSRRHVAGDWLAALAALCGAQLIAAQTAPAALAGRTPRAPLHPAEWRRGEEWRTALATILERMRSISLPAPAREAVSFLEVATPGELESLAGPLLGSQGAPPDGAAALFLAAALQVYFASIASQVPPGQVERSSRTCPVCDSPPVAGILREERVRYLSCSLCATEWHMVRGQCAICTRTAGVSYFAIEDADGIRAEACTDCRTYLKLSCQENVPAAEPLADDAASLALDLLMSHEGYSRGGVNLLVTPGALSSSRHACE